MIGDDKYLVDYIIKFWKNSVKYFRSYGKFGPFKLVGKVSQKLFELVAWNLVSWLGMMSRLAY